jgi:hypothetical protein
MGSLHYPGGHNSQERRQVPPVEGHQCDFKLIESPRWPPEVRTVANEGIAETADTEGERAQH